jgi:hypothetical protein
MDYYIRTRNTGSPGEFAAKMGISERSLYEYINILKELGAPVAFSFHENSYIYYEEGKLKISFLLNDQTWNNSINGKGTHLQIHGKYLNIIHNLIQPQKYYSESEYF